ncbi:MAG: hypothetical protein KGJ60_04535 [Verrucomicrobiota bacterium]|nr:hypothetical protein [Verrucomicrobiota bacterium]
MRVILRSGLVVGGIRAPLWPALVAALSLSTAPGFSSRAAGMKTLPGHVPAIVSQLTPKGLLSASTNLNLVLGLPLRNPGAMANLLQQVYDPACTNYHRYLTPDEFAAQFGPSEQDYQQVIAFAKANGLAVTGTTSNRMLVDVRGSAGNIEKAFNLTLHVYKHPAENRDFFAPDANPSVPAGLPVLDISGLDNYQRPHPNYVLKSSSRLPGVKPGAATGSGPFGDYIGDDFRNAYVPGTALNGSGQTIGLLQFDGYLASDIAEYESLAGRTNVPLQNVLLDGFNGQPTGNGGEVEVSLDIEMVVSMAPSLAKVVVYEAGPFGFPNDILNEMANPTHGEGLPHQISCSWGWGGGPSATTDQIFQQMALQGQTFFTASGDSDAYPAGEVDNPFGPGAPADHPYLTSVGGTTLTMNGSGNSYASETVWNWGIRYGSAFDGVGSSGGISGYYSIPSWQTNLNMTANGGSTTFRNFPDVAMTADDVFVIADGGVQYPGTAGTSCATPLWAGFTALVNQQAAINGHHPVGFLNPALYAVASTNYNAGFHDITAGNNTWSGSPNLFYAVSGYDLCTGLGTPNGTNLINALTAVAPSNVITHLSPPPPPYGATLSALNGANPNGTWQLFVQDDAPLNAGVISNGWILTLTTASPVGTAADLGLTLGASPLSVLVSNNVTLVLTVTNYGPSSVSSNAVVTDQLPLGVTLLSTNATRGSVLRSGSTLVWSIGNLTNAAGGARLTLVLQPVTIGNLLDYALVSADTPDPNPDDASATVSIAVNPPSPPQLAASYLSAYHTFQLNVTGSSAPTVIEASTNLADWAPIYTNTPPFTFTDPNAANYPYRFYRAIQ